MHAIVIAVIRLFWGVVALLHVAKFYCSSGGVTFLIAAIKKANRSKAPHTIFLDRSLYFTVIHYWHTKRNGSRPIHLNSYR